MGKANQQVNPKVAAVLILAVLVAIQVVWWRGLVMKPKPGPSGPMRGGGGAPPGPPTIQGRKDVGVMTLAGAPEPGDIDGPGYAARFDGPLGIALDAHGDLIVADSRNHRIRKMTPNGHTVTVAGTVAGYADGPAAGAKFNCPCGVAVGSDGAVYVADTGNDRVRRIKDGNVTTLSGSGQGPNAGFHAPCGLAYVEGRSPFLYVADALNRRVQAVDLQGKFLSTWSLPGTPLAIRGGTQPVAAVSGVGLVLRGGKTLAAIPIDMQGVSGPQAEFTLRHPVGLAPAPDGWFVIDGNHAALFYVRGGRAALIAGICRGHLRASDWHDADGERAKFGRPGGLVSDGRGTLYLADTSNNCIRRIALPPDLRGRQEARP